MDKLKIFGKSDLLGSIKIPGAKNSALPIMISSMLSKEELHLQNIPRLIDIISMKELLKNFGLKIIENQINTASNNGSIKAGDEIELEMTLLIKNFQSSNRIDGKITIE